MVLRTRLRILSSEKNLLVARLLSLPQRRILWEAKWSIWSALALSIRCLFTDQVPAERRPRGELLLFSTQVPAERRLREGELLGYVFIINRTYNQTYLSDHEQRQACLVCKGRCAEARDLRERERMYLTLLKKLEVSLARTRKQLDDALELPLANE